MPGPKATDRQHKPDHGSSDPKARKRIARRRAAMPTDPKISRGFHTPGSENRSK